MNFEEALAAFSGRHVEVLQTNQFIQGTLASSSGGILGVDTVTTNYIPRAQRVNIPTTNVVLVRILPL
ncbi:hypothetical protein BK138_34150 [Paenibacillus rhizosphaerae]|uniref:DUF2642 domain-containing protein n=1 Tax=Paenibacillus rhizosphaerae TaxID=297318 RepID=A0A1R1DZI4_9BACL|nr:hypothetical protein [Paenibacillus rhizosphaerae]OMF45013.1 hypothetical protein BK138_34150 [Paenibacillus rhizosphaerae]